MVYNLQVTVQNLNIPSARLIEFVVSLAAFFSAWAKLTGFGAISIGGFEPLFVCLAEMMIFLLWLSTLTFSKLLWAPVLCKTPI